MHLNQCTPVTWSKQTPVHPFHHHAQHLESLWVDQWVFVVTLARNTHLTPQSFKQLPTTLYACQCYSIHSQLAIIWLSNHLSVSPQYCFLWWSHLAETYCILQSNMFPVLLVAISLILNRSHIFCTLSLIAPQLLWSRFFVMFSWLDLLPWSHNQMQVVAHSIWSSVLSLFSLKHSMVCFWTLDWNMLSQYLFSFSFFHPLQYISFNLSSLSNSHHSTYLVATHSQSFHHMLDTQWCTIPFHLSSVSQNIDFKQ